MPSDVNGHPLKVGDVVNIPVKIEFFRDDGTFDCRTLYPEKQIQRRYNLTPDLVVFAAPDYPRDELAHDMKQEYCGE